MTDETKQSKGWVKFYRSIEDNPLLMRNRNCYWVFTRLLVVVDRRTGSYRAGKKAMADRLNMNVSTYYATVKRLEAAGMLRLDADKMFTTLHICNWSKYQAEDLKNVTDLQPIRNQSVNGSDRSKSDNSQPIRNQSVTNLQPYNKKEKEKKTNTCEDLFTQLATNIGSKATYSPSYEKLLSKALKSLTAEKLMEASVQFASWFDDNYRDKKWKTIAQFLSADKNGFSRYMTAYDDLLQAGGTVQDKLLGAEQRKAKSAENAVIQKEKQDKQNAIMKQRNQNPEETK